MSVLDHTVYEQAERLDCLGLHPSHDWGYLGEGDCFDGIHAGIRCRNCEIEPFSSWLCYHELPWSAEGLPTFLQERGVRVELAALQPCPDA